jgi:uncharacterized damage-inducible protein DinB
MNKEIRSIISNLQNVLDGEPWFGRPVYTLLAEIEEATVYTKPNEASHSLIELLYHTLTWAEFTLKRIEKDKIKDLAAFEAQDWITINPAIHTWENGLKQLKKIHEAIISRLQTKEDNFLNETVDYRNYDFRFLLNGLIQHNIYHAGQIAYLKKLLS